MERIDDFELLQKRVKDLEDSIKTTKLTKDKKIDNISRLYDNKVALLDRQREFYDTKLHLIEVGDYRSIYALYDIRELGLVLARLASEITREAYEFKVENEFGGQVTSRNVSFRFYEEVASIVEKEEKKYSWRYFNQFKKLIIAKSGRPSLEVPLDNAIYNSYLKNFTFFGGYDSDEFICKFRCEEAPYIVDFIKFVSNYRLENKIELISLKELVKLKSDFLKINRDKYKMYSKEKAIKFDNYWDDKKEPNNKYCLYDLEMFGSHLAELISRLYNKNYEFIIARDRARVYMGIDFPQYVTVEAGMIKDVDSCAKISLVSAYPQKDKETRLADKIYIGYFVDNNYYYNNHSHLGRNFPKVLKEFICYVSEYRLKNGVVTLTEDILVMLENNFIEEYNKRESRVKSFKRIR